MWFDLIKGSLMGEREAQKRVLAAKQASRRNNGSPPANLTPKAMGWSLGYDTKWHRDIGYGVPAYCDAPKCNAEIDRGLSFVCGAEEPCGGENGCGLYFCSAHKYFHHFRDGTIGFFCKRCITHKPPYEPKPEHPRWLRWKLTRWKRRVPA